MGEKSVTNLLSAIEKSKQRPLSSLISGLGILHVGSETSELLAKQFKSVDTIAQVSLENFEAIPGIGSIVGAALVEYFQNSENLAIIEKLRSAGVNFTENENLEEYVSSFIGLRFVVTGRIEGYTRSELEQYIKNRGGSVSSSVSSKTNFVVAGEDAGSKLSDAEKLNVSIISFAELQNLDRQGLN